MQTTSKLPECFRDCLLFNSISQYLTIQQILRLTLINKQFKQIIQQYCKNLLKELKMRPSSHKSYIHQMQFYFNRCLRIIRQDKNMENKEGIEEIWKSVTTINHPFKFETIKLFQVGTTYTCYLTRDEKAKIFRTSQLVRIYQQAKQLRKEKYLQIDPKFEVRNGVRDIRCKSEQAVLIKVNGQVSLLSTNKNEQNIIMSEETLAWSSRVPIKSVINSYNYSIFVFESHVDLKTIMYEVFGKEIINQENKEQKEEKIYYICRNMLLSKQFILQIPCSEVLELTVGNRYGYFISEKNQLYETDLQEYIDAEIPIIKAKIFQPLKESSIVKIFNGYNYYIALERNIEQLEEWDTERVVQWLREIGFEAYAKIARFEKLDGKKLKNIEKKYMHNVLGITKQNMQQKFIMSIEENLHKKSNNDKLWGWGKNQSGQLGSSSANFISKPQKIRFTCLLEGEYIDSVFCGWFQTFVRTQKGRIFCTVGKKDKRRKFSEKDREKQEDFQQQKIEKHFEKVSKSLSDSQQQETDFKFDRVKNKGKYSKQVREIKKKKKTTQTHNYNPQKQKNNRKFEQQQNWYQLPLGKAFHVQTYKDILFLIQCPIQNKQQPDRNKKLRTAKAILDKILWSNLNKEEFKVGYMDKDMGLIEASAFDMEKFDVKENRVKYFKRNNIIIWDRDNKIDIF